MFQNCKQTNHEIQKLTRNVLLHCRDSDNDWLFCICINPVTKTSHSTFCRKWVSFLIIFQSILEIVHTKRKEKAPVEPTDRMKIQHSHTMRNLNGVIFAKIAASKTSTILVTKNQNKNSDFFSWGNDLQCIRSAGKWLSFK